MKDITIETKLRNMIQIEIKIKLMQIKMITYLMHMKIQIKWLIILIYIKNLMKDLIIQILLLDIKIKWYIIGEMIFINQKKL